MCDDLAGKWHVGDKCLAPFPENGKLCEATITSLETDENGNSFAVVSFRGSQEDKILISNLCSIKTSKYTQKNLIFDDEDLEKPHFPGRRFPSSEVDYELSKDGDRIPYTINRYLRDYQREGAQFLHGHCVCGRGCILGDDMGLGKTIQVISFLAAVLHKKGTRADIESNMPEFLRRTLKKEMPSVPKKTFLIVAPLSVLYNWKDELETWGYFKVTVLHGNRKDYEMSRIKQGKFEVALTTYETLRLCLDDLNSLEWSAVIVDEVHRIKNPKAQITQTMKALKCKVRLGLTGTILQNNMKELWCVMDWAVPGLLGNEVRFKKEFSDPVEHGQRHTATKRELATGRKAMQRLAQKMSGYFLRRTKALINDQLPKKEDRMVYCSLTEFQRAVYKTVLETEDVHLVLRAGEPCCCNSGRKRKYCCYKTNAHGETMRALYFSYLTVLRKIANHAALLQTDNTSKQQEAYITRVCSQVFSKFPDFVKLSKDAAFETISDPKYSGKMKNALDYLLRYQKSIACGRIIGISRSAKSGKPQPTVLQKLLNHFRKKKDKVLLFSFSTKLLDVLEQYCMASGLDYRRLDGNTKAEDRVKIVKEFNSMKEVNICLVSTMAGGLGLNFVGANIVILFDPTWNPANDLQAIDRAYRIGQCRDVKVFRLISLGTVEEMMYLRQVYKQQLHCAVVGSENAKRYFEAVQGSKQHQGELFGIHNLFKLQDHGSCLTKEILEREGQVEAGVMTATTWLKEEPQEHATEMHAEGGCEDQDTAISRKLLKREEFDYSSDFSDEEPVRNSKEKAEQSQSCNTKNSKVLQGQLTLLQCGFPKLLERGTEITKDDNCIAVSSDESVGGKSTWQISKESSQNECSLKTEYHCSIAGPQRALLSPIKAEKQELHRETTNCDYPVSLRSEEKDPGNKYKDMHILNQVGVVMETECSSSDSDNIIFPSQIHTDQQSVKSYKGAATNCEHLGTEKSPTHTPLEKRLTSEHSRRSVSSYSKITPFGNIRKITSEKETSDISDESDDIELSGSGMQTFTSILKGKRFCHRGLDSSSTRTALLESNSRDGESSADSQNIDEFSSPEDGIPIHIRRERLRIKPKLPANSRSLSLTLRKRSSSDRHQTSFSEQTFESQGKNVGSLDRLLGDVAEVSYVHSNQNVVGSSKAENQMSRWALQDVFELQQFSQLPANVAVRPAKIQNLLHQGRQTCAPPDVPGLQLPSAPSSKPVIRDDGTCSPTTSGGSQKNRKNPWEAFLRKKNTKKDNSVNETNKPSVLYVRHPVCQKQKKVHQVGTTTFLVGKTPQRIRRKQFEEIASHFQKASVEEFAKHIIKTTSEERQKMLKEFYSAKYPELKDLLKVDVPVSVSEGSEEGDVHRAPFRKRKAISKHGKSKSDFSTDLYGQKRHHTETKQFQYDPFIQAAMCHNVEDKQLLTVITQDSVSRRNSQAFKNFMASDSLSSKSGIIEGLSANTTKGQPNLEGTESPREPFLSPSESRHVQMCKENSFADILGDTSILNDLFKSNENRPTEPPRKTLSGPAEKARTRPKDFWDMLNEQNDESLEKLTDVAVIEKLCERAPPVTSSKKEEDEKSLWKKNDNFLWKRYATDTDDKSLSGT